METKKLVSKCVKEGVWTNKEPRQTKLSPTGLVREPCFKFLPVPVIPST